MFGLMQCDGVGFSILLHGEHDSLLRNGLDILQNEVTLDGIEVESLIGTANEQDVAVHVAVRQCFGDELGGWMRRGLGWVGKQAGGEVKQRSLGSDMRDTDVMLLSGIFE